MKPPILPLACLGLALLPLSRAADAPGSSDHPLVKRITGSEILFGKAADFDKLKLALGKLEWSGAEAKVKPYQSATVEGKIRTNYYKVPEQMGVLEVLRDYEQELREGGFEIVFRGQGDEIETPGYNNQIAREIYGMTGTYASPEEKVQWPFQHTDEKKAGYLAARKAGAAGEFHVAVYVVPNTHDKWLQIPVGRTLVRLDVCEVKARDQRMELVRSEEMAGQIALNGRVALYGILFDFRPRHPAPRLAADPGRDRPPAAGETRPPPAGRRAHRRQRGVRLQPHALAAARRERGRGPGGQGGVAPALVPGGRCLRRARGHQHHRRGQGQEPPRRTGRHGRRQGPLTAAMPAIPDMRGHRGGAATGNGRHGLLPIPS